MASDEFTSVMDGDNSASNCAEENRAYSTNDETPKNSHVQKKDFIESAKYKDSESYSSQHHHSIGTGLFLTDEIYDLPPRYRVKVIRALEHAAVLNNIPLDSDPLKLISAVPDTSDVKEVPSDSLVTFSTAKIDSNYNKNKISKTSIENSSESKGRSNSTLSIDSHLAKGAYQGAPRNKGPPGLPFSFCKNYMMTKYDCEDSSGNKNQEHFQNTFSSVKQAIPPYDTVSGSHQSTGKFQLHPRHPPFPVNPVSCKNVQDNDFTLRASLKSSQMNSCSNQQALDDSNSVCDIQQPVNDVKLSFDDQYCEAEQVLPKSRNSFQNKKKYQQREESSTNRFCSITSMAEHENLLPKFFPNLKSSESSDTIQRNDNMKVNAIYTNSEKSSQNCNINSSQNKFSKFSKKQKRDADIHSGKLLSNSRQSALDLQKNASTSKSRTNYNSKTNKDYVKGETVTLNSKKILKNSESGESNNCQRHSEETLKSANAPEKRNAPFKGKKINSDKRTCNNRTSDNCRNGFQFPQKSDQNYVNHEIQSNSLSHNSKNDRFLCSNSSKRNSDVNVSEENIHISDNFTNLQFCNQQSKFPSTSLSCKNDIDLSKTKRSYQRDLSVNSSLPQTSKTVRNSINIDTTLSDNHMAEFSQKNSTSKQPYRNNTSNFRTNIKSDIPSNIKSDVSIIDSAFVNVNAEKKIPSHKSPKKEYKSNFSSSPSHENTHLSDSLNIESDILSNIYCTSINGSLYFEKSVCTNKSKKDIKNKFETPKNHGEPFNYSRRKSDMSSKVSNSSSHSINVSSSYDDLSYNQNESAPLKNKKYFKKPYPNKNLNQHLPNSITSSKYGNSRFSISEDNVSESSDVCSIHSSEKNYSKRNRKFYEFDDKSKKNNFEHEISKEENRESRGCIEFGFFLKVEVSENAKNLKYWVSYFKKLFCFEFDIERCCHFSDTLIITFEYKKDALDGLRLINTQKQKMLNSRMPHVFDVSGLKTRLTKPCNCWQKVIHDSVYNIEKKASISLNAIDEKMKELKLSKNAGKSHHSKSQYEDAIYTKNEMLKTYKDSRSNFINFKKYIISKINLAVDLKSVQQLKVDFVRECNSVKRCLPIYSRKEDILASIQFNSVSIIVAETGSGKSTQLVEYILHSKFYVDGYIICTQPRKLAAISIAQFVSGQIGSAVGKLVGYDVGIEKKISEVTKIIYMTDYCLLKTYLGNKNLKGISFIIIDEAHERSLYTDLLLAMLKKLLPMKPELRVIITSATINPGIFVQYFRIKEEKEFKPIIYVPGRSFPVDVIWWPETIDKDFNYLEACVEKAYEIHCAKGNKGDILVFLTSPVEADEAITLFKHRMSKKDEKVLLFCLHGKSDIKEQMEIFQVTPYRFRKIIFATNVAETSVTIPGIKYVIDSGMTKELMFDPKKNKSYLAVTFINKSSAEQRKGRAGRTQSGVCYRMYSERNFAEDMADHATPEILKTNLQRAMLKIFELGIDPVEFDFIETPQKKTISNSIDSLEYLGAIENNKLTDLGRKLVKLPLEPQLSKLILLGLEAKIGYEAIIIAVLVSEAGKLFLRFEDNRTQADDKKKKFCQEGGDLCTFLEIYKRWMEVDFYQRFDWCVQNFVSSKALHAARNTIRDIIITLKTDLRITVLKEYNNSFKKIYERVLFDSFSENLCISSGHPKLGYLSPFLPESFFIHPSSTLSYLGKDLPQYLVYSTLMETSRNFLFDVTPISEETIRQANEFGSFSLPLHSLKCLQISPKIMGPFGESVLIRHILGKNGSKIKDIESRIRNFTKTKNIKVDVAVDKGLITVYVGKKYHEKIAKDINEIIDQGHLEMIKEEDVIKLSGTSSYYALSAGGIINDVIMPGEFRELVFYVNKGNFDEIKNLLERYGPLQFVNQMVYKQQYQICATYRKVTDAINAFQDLSKNYTYKVSSKPYLPNANDKTLPLYMLDVSWCRCPCIGNGWVEFASEEDLIVASSILTASSFYLDENYVQFTPSPHSTRDLNMMNLPSNADENVIQTELNKCLPKHLKIKCIKIFRKTLMVTDGDVKTAKKKLEQLFSHFTHITKLVVDIKYSKDQTAWRASVYFECFEDGEAAYRKLKNSATVDSYPVKITQVLKASLSCKKEVYNVLSKHIEVVLSNKKRKGVCENYYYKKLNNFVQVEFMSVNIQELVILKQNLTYLLQGESLDFIGKSNYHFLFSESLVETIQSIQKSTKTFISLNKFQKVLTIYGSPNDCLRAKEEVYKILLDSNLSNSRVFNLLDSCIPAGFLKSIYIKYGYDLHGLVDSFKLTMAKIDVSKNTLTLTGRKIEIKRAEKALEKLCEELYDSRGQRQKLKDAEESCPICLEPVAYDFFRLEHCGHALCRQCLLLQIESKSIPLVCAKQNCEKLIFLEDIKRIISFGETHLKKEFCAAALQYHINCSAGKISYCPTPDCQMFYRVSKEGSEYNCSECRNSICTSCKTTYHYGMSCDMFQNCQKDEDYSLKLWMAENMSDRKNCPSCNAVIEKEGGCNHMECLNCKAHLCWMCLQIFPTGKEVYDHLPLCEKNQS